MGAVVVYESMYGNTFQVATAVAEGIRQVMPVDVVEVGHVQPAEELGLVDLLVVGAPTHAFGLSRPSTRAEAARRSGRSVLSQERGMREWLAEAWPLTVPATAFDTRTVTPNLPGHAGRVLDRRLRSLGCRLLAKAESFQVHGYEGPLCDGELDRARAWGGRETALRAREVLADEHEFSAIEREHAADAILAAAGERDARADARDRVADARERTARG